MLKRLLIFLAAMIVPVAAQAQSTQQEVQLSTVLESAAARPRSVALALVSLDKLRAEEHALRGRYLPALSVEMTSGVQYDDRPVLPGPPPVRFDSTTLTAAGSLSASWAALDLERRALVQAKHAAAEAGEHDAQVEVRRAQQNALRLFFRARAAGQLVEMAGAILRRLERQQNAISELVKVGRRSKVDEVRANLATLSARRALDARTAEYAALTVALAVGIGRDPSEAVRPAEKLPSWRTPPSLEDAFEMALARRPELASLEAQRAARDHGVSAARGRLWPTVGVSMSSQAGYNEIRSGIGVSGSVFGATVGLYARWGAFDGERLRGVQLAEASRKEADLMLESELVRIRHEVVQSHLALERSQASLQQANDVHQAAAALQAAQETRYQVGVASLLELIDATEAEQEGRMGCIEAEAEFQIALAMVFMAAAVTSTALAAP